MRSAFSSENSQEPIKISVGYENLDELKEYILTHDNQPYGKWTRLSGILPRLKNRQVVIEDLFEDLIRYKNINEDEAEKLFEIISNAGLVYQDTLININNYNNKKRFEYYSFILNNEEKIKNFIIYSPENTALRNFYKEGQIEPLGINGEGLLKLLKVIQNKPHEQILKRILHKSSEQWQEIHNTLQLFDWYSEIEIPKDLSLSEDKVTITDRYLSRDFDQRSANEGFLFVLFYIALMVSDDTPKIFAIDNIDVALNPKLCTKLIKELTRLGKKYDKQLFVTSHNPAILDGIDLGDDEQRLFVVSRNKQGHTRCKRIDINDKPKSSVRDRLSRVFNEDKLYSREDILNKFDNSEEPLKLSEAFLRGYLGGLPKGF
jgi:AAA15 family ATPase/GTPase